MAIFTLKQKIFIVKRYYQCGNSTKDVQNEFPNEFHGDANMPTYDNIIELVNLFEEFGNLLKYRKESIDIDVGEIEEAVYNNTIEIKQEVDPLSNDTEFQEEIKINESLDENLEVNTLPKIIYKEKETANHNNIPYVPKINKEEIVNYNDNLSRQEINVEKTVNNDIPCEQEINDTSNENAESDTETINNTDFEVNLNSFDVTKTVDKDKETATKTISCAHCEKTFSTKHGYTKHIKVHYKYCKICKKKCSLTIDQTTSHREASLEPDSEDNCKLTKEDNLEDATALDPGDKSHWCCLCKKSYKTRIRLQAHVRTHLTDKERPQKCEVCGKGFLKKYALRLHLRTHFKEKNSIQNLTGDTKPLTRLICDVCGQSLCSKISLESHMRTHTGEKPHQCSFCDKKYSHLNILNIHIRSHTGDKPFTCNICGRSVTTKNSLKNHIETIHGGAKPFKCKVCDNSYTSWTSLKVHIRVHTGERPIKCQYCPKSFYDPATCRRHELIHTGEKPYVCTLCGKAHNQAVHLRAHMKTVHKQECIKKIKQ